MRCVGSGLCERLITRPEEFYLMFACYLETSAMRRPGPQFVCSSTERKILSVKCLVFCLGLCPFWYQSVLQILPRKSLNSAVITKLRGDFFGERALENYCLLGPNFGFHTFIPYPQTSAILFLRRVQLKCNGTRWHTGGEVKGKLTNGVGSQYTSHYLGTWCIQHYYRWCAHLGCR